MVTDSLACRAVPLALLVAGLMAPASHAFAQSTVTGTASYRERISLPPNAVFEVTLEDVSLADAPAQVIGRLQREPAGQVPINFEIAYDPATVIESHAYSVRARILVDGRLMFTTDEAYPVLTRGSGREVELLLRRVAAPPTAAAPPLEGSTWALTRLGDDAVAPNPAGERPHLIFSGEDRRFAGSGGCNRITGSYRIEGGQLALSETASTQRMCISGMELETAFLGALEQVNAWRVDGEELSLLDAQGNVLMRFEAAKE